MLLSNVYIDVYNVCKLIQTILGTDQMYHYNESV